ncbi:hypothetical protein K1T71_008351 [Dendrolimus kikuchii]|uniref:Uncharacterized protein n=1 Tax=Dendrolimus kikuchii TaxID=765133 RepID=A0ACC1CX47_9NEOP|nr:hypothetical protein K1T71_008351 [Dendrolimus kikuchii]
MNTVMDQWNKRETMLITKYTAVLLESARSSEARNSALARSSEAAWSSSLDSLSSGRRPIRRRYFAYSTQDRCRILELDESYNSTE